jgi:hypothetical protein
MNQQRISRRQLVGILTGLVAASPAMAVSEGPKVSTPTSPILVRNLTCEYRTDPLGLDTTTPRFGWQLFDPTDSRGQHQTAYRIRVASRRLLLAQDKGDLWDSGHISSDHSVAVPYAGKPLLAGDDCWWQVMVWDRDNAPSPWSEPARFSVGLLDQKDWQTQWIGMASASADACPYFRKTFTVETVPETALAYVGSVGFHELYVNGRRVGDGVLAPSISDLRQRALYVTCDVRDYLLAGENVVAIWASSGWAQFQGVNPPITFEVAKSPLCIARLQFGTPRDVHSPAPVVTDTSWHCALSTTTHRGKWMNSDFGGDHVDASREIPHWNEVVLEGDRWETATVYNPNLQLSPDPVEPNRRCETIAVKQIEPLGEGRYRVEMAEIFTGWLELTVKASPGTKVMVKTSSRPEIEVEFNQINEYVVGPTGTGVFCERFSYHQYHYVTLEGLETPPTQEQIKGYRIGNDLRRRGAFDCSNPLLKSIYDATIRTYVNLTTGGMTVDCPHRERLGYGGDGHTSLELALDHFETNAYLTKWAQDFCDVQEPNGNIYHTAPTMDGGGGPAWSGFILTLPYEIYLTYGDRRVLERTYPCALRWLMFLKTHINADGLLAPLPGRNAVPGDVKWAFLGDWAAPPHRNEANSPEALLFNNCYYVYVLGIAARIADLLNKSEEAKEYRKQAEILRKAIDTRFYKAAEHTYLDTRQAHCILPLIAGVAAGDRATEIQKTFEKELLVTQSGHLDTGLHGTYFMTKYLTEQDRSDLVFTYASKTTFPSYGDLLGRGYTTWPEYWGDAHSKTHGCLNGIGGWFQRGLAGIRPDPKAPGYRHVIIKPAIVGGLTWLQAHHDGPYGRIEVRWEREATGRLVFDITIPPNSTADIYLPESGEALVNKPTILGKSSSGIKRRRTEPGFQVFQAGSGKYRFTLSS